MLIAFPVVLLVGWLFQPTQAAAGARALHRVHVEGEGRITVVFEEGLGDTLDVWSQVQRGAASRCARTFSYNRAGYPGSENVAGPRDAEAVVKELRGELQARGISPPYLLVGHSLGGLYTQEFARNYPLEVAGMVLVDSTHWDQLGRLKRETPGSYRMLQVLSYLMAGIMRREFLGSVKAGEQVAASPRLNATPTIVLSSTQAAPGESEGFRQLAHRLQDEVAAQYSAKRHDFVEGSGHYIQRDHPEVVIRAVRECRAAKDSVGRTPVHTQPLRASRLTRQTTARIEVDVLVPSPRMTGAGSLALRRVGLLPAGVRVVATA